MNLAGFFTLTFVVFVILVVFFLPKILYLAALVYHTLFKPKQSRHKFKNYSFKQMRDIK